MKISGSLIVVTGGSRGLGAATTQLLCQRGARVLILDMQAPTFDNVPESSAYWPGKCDVGSEQDVSDCLARGLAKLGGKDWPLRGLVNCAGFGTPAPTLRPNGDPMPLATFEKDLRVNIIGSFNVSRLVASHMAKHTPPEGPDADRGVIILTASIAGYDGQARMLAYSVAKAATAAMTLPLARDLQSFGIRVMSIAPGPFATPLFETQPTKVKETLLKELVHPKRFGEGSDYALLVTQIFENRFLNGENIRLDGGVRIGRAAL